LEHLCFSTDKCTLESKRMKIVSNQSSSFNVRRELGGLMHNDNGNVLEFVKRDIALFAQ
jgi:hypothetical protein